MPAENKKRILIFSTAYLPLIGGAELAVKNITDQIGDFEFDLITAKIKHDLPNEEKIGQVNTYRVGLGLGCDKLLLPFWGVIKAIRLNHRHKYAVVWSIMASYGGFAGLFFKFFNPKAKFLLTLQEGDDLSYIKKRVGFFYPLFCQIFRQVDYVQAISNYLADWAKEMGAKCPIEVVPNGVDLGIFKPAWTVECLAKRIVVTVSRLVEKNGVRSLIEAMPEIDGELWIIGDGELKKGLERLTVDLKVEGRVKFFGNKEPQEVAELLSQASVFVRPSLSEGLGNAFLEAMAVGLPTVGTSVGGIPDFLKDGETGWFCEVKNLQSVTEKINYILAEENQAKVWVIVEAAKKLVEEKYNWVKIADGMKNVLQKLL